MLSFFVPYAVIVIILIIITSSIFESKGIFYLVFFLLIFEFFLSLISYIYISNLGFFYICCLGKIVLLPNNYNINLILIYDSLSFTFHIILIIALFVCFVFLAQYFEYDINAKSIVILSSLFSQLAFLYFLTYDLFLIIFFWEWISIVSFFLIQFWSFRVTTNKSALKVFCISQFGDLLFFVAIFLLFSFCEDTDLSHILISFILFDYINFFNFFYINLIHIISIFLSFSLFLKSAQFVFFPWLLDAMEAPVPISAQLHSSTLVIIGFYIFFRFYDIILFNHYIYSVYFIFSFFTIITATFLGFYQDDGKRLLACSTASQLGYVILAISLNLIEESKFLLIFVCCNKAFTFSWFGFIMDKSGGLSDFRIFDCSRLFFFEKSGLFFFSINSTVSIGSLNWHIKSLLYFGELSFDHSYFFICLEILNLTWFFSTIYLLKLFFSLFSLPYRITTVSFFKLYRNFSFYNYYYYFNKNYLFFCINFFFIFFIAPSITIFLFGFLSI